MSLMQPFPLIRQLPPGVVNKIAAGEVIERPASVVKELMENSVDAGATRIEVTVAQGGLELVRVADDGCGMQSDQFALALASHATSKIDDADDLFRVRTLGFRGEALASIAAVSRLVLRSRTSGDSGGAELQVVGGESHDVAPCGCPVGTTIEVHNLFFNVPVRRKFLRSVQTEMGYVSEAFTRIALAHPHIHCTLRHQTRAIYELPATDDWRLRIEAFFGSELADSLIAVTSEDGGVSVHGYVANPSHSRANNRMQYLFLNGRAIRDRSLQHALQEAYRGLLLTGRYPIAFLRIEMPPEQVDVNVHPTKLEVRFQESGRLYSQLLGTLRSRFLTTDLTARLQPVEAHEGAAAHDGIQAAELRRNLVDWAKGQLQGGAGGPAAGGAGEGEAGIRNASINPGRFQFDEDHPLPAHAPLELVRLDRNWPAMGNPTGQTGGPRAGELHAGGPSDGPTVAGDPFPVPGSHGPGMATRIDAAVGAPIERVGALQIHNRYLITESDEGVVVIDQHALHERILYEHLRAKVLAGALESQALLVPEPVDLSPAEAAAVIDAQDVLAKLGVTVAPFGGGTVLVSSYPAMLANVPPAEVLRDLVDRLLAGGKSHDRRDLLDELLHMISCKAAIKAGDRLSGDEIAALLTQRHLAQDTHHCPHGRPTALVFTREELDRQFKRT
jgi:DNA mismatch repair protein MutL